MFNRLIDFLIGWLELFRFWVIIDQMEEGLIFTLGRDTRQIGPRNGLFHTGLHPKAPFGIEEAISHTVQWEWENLALQAVMTKDGVRVSVEGTFEYRIRREKIRTFIVDLGDEEQVMVGAFGAAIQGVVERHTFVHLQELGDVMGESILTEARKHLNDYGFQLRKFRWVQKTDARTYRFLME